MTGLRLHHSNRLEVLATELARLMRADPVDPFAPERIVVPHPTTGRWLSLELARGLGIAANIRFEQPAEFAWSIMRGVVPELSREQPYLPARLRWRIHDLLPGPDGAPRNGAEGGDRPFGRAPAIASRDAPDAGGGAPAPASAVAAYLRDGDPRKRLELADRLARMYDQCLLYRPDWIRAWENGPAPHWQARLWQLLVAADGPGGAHHWVNALDRFHAGLRDRDRDPVPGPEEDAPADRSPQTRPPGWPRRACFFAVPSLSPSYLELIRGAAREIEIHLFLLDPCREYWGDIHSRREIDYRAGGADPEARYLTEGNELLAAWGRAARDSIDALVEVEGAEWDEHFVEPSGARRLAAVQRDILDLRLAREAAGSNRSPEGESGRSPEDGLGRALEGESDRVPEGGPGWALEGESDRSPEDEPGRSPEGGLGRSPEDGADRTPEGDSDLAPEAAPASPGAGGSNAAGSGSGEGADDSIQVHVCHSPVREAEVLHDRLLAVFDAHPDLEPADVLVLTPELDIYGPAVGAVFAAAGRMSCHVARARAVESRTMRAFLDLLSLPGSRHAAEAVLAPLAAPSVRARFGIGEADVAIVREWVREAGIRWGVDEAHRGEEDLPETADHTWRHGLRRLLLGYAMADAGVSVAGLVPCGVEETVFGIGEMDGELLGRLVSYCERVFGLRARLAGRRRPAHWGAELHALVRDFLADGSEPAAGGPLGRSGAPPRRPLARELADEVGAVRALVRELEHEASAAESPVPVEVVVDVLRERAHGAAREAARMAHGVTVAGLGAGRIFPAGVVCVVGMNDGVFPRSPSAPSFDVVAAGRARRGDRDVRHEDRFAFLEALLAARRCFIVTYAGRGLRDDAPIPPSVLVDELKDYLGRRFPGRPVEVRHPLQPFSPRYFEATGDTGFGEGEPGRGEEGPGLAQGEPGLTEGEPGRGEEGLFSYSRGMCDAANLVRTAGRAGREPWSRLADVELDAPDESRRCVDLADLAAFFANPVRHFLRDRLGVRLEPEEPVLDDEEPFELDGLERYRLSTDIWDQMRAGVDPGHGAALLHGSGRLPQAALGRIVHEKAREEVEPLDALLAPYREALRARPRPVDFELGAFRIVGTIGHVGPHRGFRAANASRGPESAEPEPHTMVWWRMGKLRARDRIEVWLRQLAWMAAGYGPLEAVVVSRSRDGKSWQSRTFAPPEEIHERLRRWLDAWWRGQSSPLRIFPETSLAYARAIAPGGDEGGDEGGARIEEAREEAREKARAVWFGSRFTRGEQLDPCFALVHDSGDPLTGSFESLAEELLVPLASAQP